jgi:hypothetical protein
MSEIKRMTAADIEDWPHHVGKKECVKWLNGEPLSYKEVVLGACYLCMSGYDGGTMDCKGFNCINYSYMPYRPKEKNPNKKGRTMTEEHKAKMKEGRKKKGEGK